MHYHLLKIIVRLAIPLFSKQVTILQRSRLHTKGPLLLAVNHPNSFLDAFLLGAFMQEPVHFVARGDVFRHPVIKGILEAFNMIPIFRIRDGKEKLSLNEETFLKSVAVLRNNGILLIFVEGFCENQTTLQLPLKKGAPRILQSCWQQGIPAKVLPVWLQYSSFNRLGKTIEIRMGEVFGQSLCNRVQEAGCLTQINVETARQLLHLHGQQPFVPQVPNALIRWGLLVPAIMAVVLHAPLYLPAQKICRRQTMDNPHYDSVLVLVLLITYPIFLLVVAYLLYTTIGHWWSWPLILLGMPLLARCYILWKKTG